MDPEPATQTNDGLPPKVLGYGYEYGSNGPEKKLATLCNTIFEISFFGLAVVVVVVVVVVIVLTRRPSHCVFDCKIPRPFSCWFAICSNDDVINVFSLINGFSQSEE